MSTESPSASPNRRHLSDFETLESLGKGQFAEVVKVRDKTNQQVFAMKIFPKANVISDKKMLSLFQTEVSILKTIDHPNIVRFYGKLEDPKHYYLVFTYCGGGDLETYIKSHGTMDEKQAYNFLDQIVDAFLGLHRKRIMHRDLKPANILLETNQQRAVLADFGLAKFGTDFAQSTLGTPIYTAPEVFLSEENQYSNTADLWSLGVVFYRMLYGVEPWSVNSWAELSRKIQTLSGAKLPFPPEPRNSEKIPTRVHPVSSDTIKLLQEMICPVVQQRITWEELRKRVSAAVGKVHHDSADNPYKNTSNHPKSAPVSPHPAEGLVSCAGWESVPARFEGFEFPEEPKDEYMDEFEEAFENPHGSVYQSDMKVPVRMVTIQPPAGFEQTLFARNITSLTQLRLLATKISDSILSCLGDWNTVWCAFTELSARILLLVKEHSSGLTRGYSLDDHPSRAILIKTAQDELNATTTVLRDTMEPLEDVKRTLGDPSRVDGPLYAGLNSSLDSAYFSLAAALGSQNPKFPQELVVTLKELLSTAEIVNKWAASMLSLEKHTETNPWCNVFNSMPTFENLSSQKGNLTEVETKISNMQKLLG